MSVSAEASSPSNTGLAKSGAKAHLDQTDDAAADREAAAQYTELDDVTGGMVPSAPHLRSRELQAMQPLLDSAHAKAWIELVKEQANAELEWHEVDC
jgi:hypothetical protein